MLANRITSEVNFLIMVHSVDLARQKFKKVHQMVGSLEKVKEKDQEARETEMAIKNSQKNDPKPKGKGKKKRGLFEQIQGDSVFVNAANAMEGDDNGASKRKKPKKTPASSTTTSGSLNQPSTVSELLWTKF